MALPLKKDFFCGVPKGSRKKKFFLGTFFSVFIFIVLKYTETDFDKKKISPQFLG